MSAGRGKEIRSQETDCESAALAVFKRGWGRRRLAIRLFETLLRPLTWMSKPEASSSLHEVARILVFEPGSLGDMVMLMPFLRNLRAGFPNAKVSLLFRKATSGKGYASLDPSSVETLLLEQGLVDELIPTVVPWLVDASPWKRYNPLSLNWPRFALSLLRLRSRKFDLSFPSGRSDMRHNMVLWLTGARRRVGYGYAGAGFLLTDIAKPDVARPHQTDFCLQLLEHIGIPVIRESPLLKLSSEDEEFSANFFKDRGIEEGDVVVGIHAGSRTASRTWGQERFLQVARRLTEEFGVKAVWFGDPTDSNVRALGPNIAVAALPLAKFLAVLARCSFLVCNDSGPMHMSAALGVPVIAIFGSTFPEWFRPPGDSHRVIVRRDMPCRPCGDRCILDQPYCLRLIPVEQVMGAVTDSLKTLGPSHAIPETRR